MNDKIEKASLEDNLNSILEKSKNKIFAASCVVVVALVAVIAGTVVKSHADAKAIELTDSVYYAYTKNSSSLSDSEISERQNEVLSKLSSLSSKKGIAGIRSNMLIADVLFSQEKYEESRSAWLKAASANKKAYTAPLCYYNAAVCSDNLNDAEGALKYYTLASDFEDFLLVDHALFNVGRVQEEKGNFDAARDAYDKIYTLRSASNWAFLGKSRIIALKAEGKLK